MSRVKGNRDLSGNVIATRGHYLRTNSYNQLALQAGLRFVKWNDTADMHTLETLLMQKRNYVKAAMKKQNLRNSSFSVKYAKPGR